MKYEKLLHLACKVWNSNIIKLNKAIRILRSEDPLLKMEAENELRNRGTSLLRDGQRVLDKLNITIDHELVGTPITLAEQKRIGKQIRQLKKLHEDPMSKHMHSI